MNEKEIIAEVMKELYFDSLFNEEAEHIEKAIRLTISKLQSQVTDNQNGMLNSCSDGSQKTDSLRGEELKDGK